MASNIVGLFLFHDHGHSHGPSGGHEHSHDAEDEESGHAHTHTHENGPTPRRSGHVSPMLDEDGSIGEILPETVVARVMSAHAVVKPPGPRIVSTPPPQQSRGGLAAVTASPFTLARMSGESHHSHRVRVSGETHHSHRHSSSESRQRTFADPATSIHVYPAQNRQEIINAASGRSSDDERDEIDALPRLQPQQQQRDYGATSYTIHDHNHDHDEHPTSKPAQTPTQRRDSHSHSTHFHSQPKPTSSSHSHQDLNMRGVFLHVLGDALGNIGVIITAIFIWRTEFWWRYYSDPLVSLFITGIIFASALPLVKSASKILLQAVPKGISLDEVKADILSIRGVESVHELHIWQLSDVKRVASLHIQVAFDPEGHDEGEGGHVGESEEDVDGEVEGGRKRGGGGQGRYMRLAKAIRTCLHAYGIHSSTIQPEYSPKGGSLDGGVNDGNAGGRNGSSLAPGAGAVRSGCTNGRHNVGRRAAGHASEDSDATASDSQSACLMECGEECGWW